MKPYEIEAILDDMNKLGRVNAVRTMGEETVVVVVGTDDKKFSYDLYSKELISKLRHEIYSLYNETVSTKQADVIIDKLELMSFDQFSDTKLCKRVFNDHENRIIYDLSIDDCVIIEPGEVYIESACDVLFKRTPTYLPQVEPNLNVEPTELIPLLRKHFNIADEYQLNLLAIYLVSCFYGLNTATPIAVVVGEKGSAKSNMLRKLCKIIDPKTNPLCGMQGDIHNLQLRLGSDYFLALDNLSYINQKTSDLLAQSSTGGTISKRRLHTDQDQVYIDLRCLVAMNSINMVVKESDLLDRSIIFNLTRIPPNRIKTEKEVWDSFDEDLPCILGACFNALSEALACEVITDGRELIRLADFHLLAYKIAYVLGLEESEVDAAIWENQKRVNREAIDGDEVGACLLEIMSDRDEYVGAMHELLREIKAVAQTKEISPKLIPASPNHLSRRLRKMEENLKQAYRISFVIKNVGNYKQITITKKQ